MTVERSPPAPNLPPPTAKTPGIVVTALVMSIVGITGITAVIGIILGFIGRSKAKQVGKGSGMALAAIIIGALEPLRVTCCTHDEPDHLSRLNTELRT